MLFDLPARDAALSFEVAKMIAMLRSDDPMGRITAAAESFLPNSLQRAFVPNVRDEPTYFCIRWPSLGMILIDGVTVPAQAFSYVSALSEAPDWINNMGINSYCARMATLIKNAMFSDNNTLPLRMIVAGHSMGGATALAITRLLPYGASGSNASTITYGSPKTGPTVFAERMQREDIARWFAPDDPVPNVPPTAEQCALWWATTDRNTRSACNSYAHTHGGIEITNVGSVTPDDRPFSAEIDMTVSLGAWLYFCAVSLPNQHSMNSYVSRLLAYKQALGLRRASQGGSTHAGEAVVATPREDARAAKAAADALAEEAAIDAQEAVVIPPTELFTAKKVGAIWVTQLRGETISLGPTRRRASSLAAKGNVFLRRMQRSTRLDGAALVYALEQYLVDASNPDSGFRPTLRA